MLFDIDPTYLKLAQAITITFLLILSNIGIFKRMRMDNKMAIILENIHKTDDSLGPINV